MKWIRSSLWSVCSENGLYSIAKVSVNGSIRYELWQTGRDGNRPKHLSTHDTAEAAKAAMPKREVA